MKKIILSSLLAIVAALVAPTLSASTGFFGNGFIVLSLNGGANTFYDFNPATATANPDFNGTFLGTFNVSLGNTLVIKGGEFNTFQDGGDNVSTVTLRHGVAPTPTTVSTFNDFNVNFVSQAGNNKFWQTTGGSTNVLTGLSNGTYNFSVFGRATTTPGDRFYNNGGSNYTATFTVVPEPSTIGLLSLAGVGALGILRRRR